MIRELDYMTYLLFLAGFPCLLAGAYLLVRGAGSLALSWGVSELTIGLTIVALGTSAPELVVSLLAAIKGNADLAVGNVVGSNIANLLLILGTAALITPLKLSQSLRWREIPFVLLSALVLAVLANDHLVSGHGYSMLDRGDGLVMLVFFAIFLYYVFSVAKSNDAETVEKIEPAPIAWAVSMVIVGAGGLALGGQWIVDGAVILARGLGVSQAVIGLTVVAFGTSLPELATSLLAAWRGNADLSVGNVIGSNILNIFWILGLTAAVTPIDYNQSLNLDIWLLVVATILFFIFTYTGRRHCLDRVEGGLFLVIYIGYLAFLAWRG
jgi:cation:H+ antiporter